VLRQEVPGGLAAIPFAYAAGKIEPAEQDCRLCHPTGRWAATDPGMELLSIMHFGVISQHLANDPDRDWDHGRYTRRHREILPLFIKAYPPRT
jgi:hypothetical protein